MSNIDPDMDAFGELPEQSTERSQGSAKDLRRQVEEGNRAKAELAAAQRELAFFRAGVNLEHPAGKLLLKAYDGDLDPAKIKAEAEALGALKAIESAAKAESNPLTPDEIAAFGERQALAQGASSAATPPSPDPYTEAYKLHAEQMTRGAKKDDAMAAAVGLIRQAGAKGDDRTYVKVPQI